MSKQFKKPSERAHVPDPDAINVENFDHQISTDNMRKSESTNTNPEYRAKFTQVRIERPVTEEFRKLCKERGIRFYGNYINAVLKSYLDGTLQNK